MGKRDDGYSDSLSRSEHLGGSDNKAAENHAPGSDRAARQHPGGNHDNTPGNVGVDNVNAHVFWTRTESGPKGLDSMGGSESRGKGNEKNKGY
jgi:hypothetical protein